MTQEPIERLRIELTHKKSLGANDVANITDPDVALQFAKDAAQFAVFAQAHAEYARAVAYGLTGFTPKPVYRHVGDTRIRVDREVPDGITAAARRADDARLEAPAILSVDHATTSVIKATESRNV